MNLPLLVWPKSSSGSPGLPLLNLDGRKVRNSAGKIPGKKCGGSYISASYNCRSHKKGGKMTAEGKASAKELAAKVRKKRGLKKVKEKKAFDVKGAADIFRAKLSSEGKLQKIAELMDLNDATALGKGVDDALSRVKASNERLTMVQRVRAEELAGIAYTWQGRGANTSEISNYDAPEWLNKRYWAAKKKKRRQAG